eukprot:GEMP01053738.1.p1 GENE.GEMP01053738.1~~GEMP01053738.1.p1  ORF type:complete len:220 (+),score=65.70 GEMP01053738.1:86-745(+)
MSTTPAAFISSAASSAASSFAAAATGLGNLVSGINSPTNDSSTDAADSPDRVYDKFCKKNSKLVLKIDSLRNEHVKLANEYLNLSRILEERSAAFGAVQHKVHALAQNNARLQEEACVSKQSFEAAQRENTKLHAIVTELTAKSQQLLEDHRRAAAKLVQENEILRENMEILIKEKQTMKEENEEQKIAHKRGEERTGEKNAERGNARNTEDKEHYEIL